MMPYGELLATVVRSLDRARALGGIAVVRDLYETEVDEASRGLMRLLCHPDHETGRVPSEMMREINTRFEGLWPTVANHTRGIQR